MDLSLLFRVRPFLSRQRSRLDIYLALLLVSALLAVTVPLAFQRVVDEGLAVGAMGRDEVDRGGPGAGLIAAAAGAIANAIGAEIGARISESLRTGLFARIIAQPYAFHAQSKAGAVVSRLTRSPSRPRA